MRVVPCRYPHQKHFPPKAHLTRGATPKETQIPSVENADMRSSQPHGSMLYVASPQPQPSPLTSFTSHDQPISHCRRHHLNCKSRNANARRCRHPSQRYLFPHCRCFDPQLREGCPYSQATHLPSERCVFSVPLRTQSQDVYVGDSLESSFKLTNILMGAMASL